MTRRRPRGTVTVSPGTADADVEALRPELGDGYVILSADVEYHPIDWQVPDPQTAFTLRAVMSAHQAARQHLAQLRTRQAAAANVGTASGQLSNAARVEATRQQIEVAEAREAEVRAELAEAHARATGHPLPESPRPSAGPPGDPLPESPRPSAGPPGDPLGAARAHLQAAQHSAQQTRERLQVVRARPGQIQRDRACALRRLAVLLAALSVLAPVAAIQGWTILLVVATVAVLAIIGYSWFYIGTTERAITRTRAALPDATEDYDVALRRLVAAEAGLVAAGGDLVPSTLDTDVEQVAGQ